MLEEGLYDMYVCIIYLTMASYFHKFHINSAKYIYSPENGNMRPIIMAPVFILFVPSTLVK